MIDLLSQAAVVLACALLIFMSVEIIGAIDPGRMWSVFSLWASMALVAFAVAVEGRDLPWPAALLLLVMAMLLWRQRRRIVFAVENGRPW